MKYLFSFLVKKYMDCLSINSDSKMDMLPSLIVNFSFIRVQTCEDNTGKTNRKIDWYPIGNSSDTYWLIISPQVSWTTPISVDCWITPLVLFHCLPGNRGTSAELAAWSQESAVNTQPLFSQFVLWMWWKSEVANICMLQQNPD